MANQGSTRMTTTQLRAMIAGGATRSQLPTKASGQSVSSTPDSAQRAYLAQLQKIARTEQFKAEQQQTARQASQARTAQMIAVSENTTVMPSYDSQSQKVQADYSDTSRYVVHGQNPVTNNNVNPSSLFPNQPVNVTGQSQNSSVNGGINVNANFNTAAALNDYQNAHPNSSVNHGQTVNSPYYTAGKSSIPYDNDTRTSLLGGDIQHQESDVNTNLEYELPLSQQSQFNVNWAQSMPSLGIATLAVGGLAAYMLLRKKK